MIIMVGAILNIIRRDGTRTTVRTLRRVDTTASGIVHSNGLVSVGDSRLIPNSIIILRTNSTIPTSYHVFRYTDVGVRRTTLANRSIPISGLVTILGRGKRGSIPLNSHGGVTCVNSAIICKHNGTIIITANVSARVNGVTRTVSRTRRKRAPLRVGLSRLSGVLAFLILNVYIILFTFRMVATFLEGNGIRFGVFLRDFVITISLTITTVPRNLTTIIAVMLSVNIAGVSGGGTVVEGLATIRALNYTRVVYSSGANALARGGVAIMSRCNSGRPLVTGTVTLYYSTRVSTSNVIANRPARTTLMCCTGRLSLGGGSLATGTPHVNRTPFSSNEGVVSAIRSAGRKVVRCAGNTPSIVLGGYTCTLVGNRVVPFASGIGGTILSSGGHVTSGTLHILTITFGGCSATPTSCGPRILRGSLIFVNLANVVSPTHPRIRSTVRRYGDTKVAPVVVANSRGSATITVTLRLNVVSSPSTTVANTRLSRVDSRRFTREIDRFHICTHIRPRRGAHVIGT